MSPLQVPQQKRINIRILEISNGFMLTVDGEHTFVATYEEALMALPPPPKSQSANRARKSK